MRVAPVNILVAWALLLAAGAAAHTVVSCTDYRPRNNDLHSEVGGDQCYGYPRGYVPGILEPRHLECYVYGPGNGGHAAGKPAKLGSDCYKPTKSQGVGGFACDPATQRRTTPFSAAYDATAPYAKYRIGRDVCIEWPSMNHGLHQFYNGSNQTYSTGPVYINAVQAGLGLYEDAEPNQAAFNGGLLATLAYDDCSTSPDTLLEALFNPDEFQAGRSRPCRGCFSIPKDWVEGRYIFQFLWELNTDEWYTTCWDAVVTLDGDNFTAPPMKMTRPRPRTISVSAGVPSTLGWVATPVDPAVEGEDMMTATCPRPLQGINCDMRLAYGGARSTRPQAAAGGAFPRSSAIAGAAVLAPAAGGTGINPLYLAAGPAGLNSDPPDAAAPSPLLMGGAPAPGAAAAPSHAGRRPVPRR